MDYGAFVRAFENVIECKTSSSSERLYYLEQSLDEMMDLILFINTTNVRQICYNICPFIKDDKSHVIFVLDKHKTNMV